MPFLEYTPPAAPYVVGGKLTFRIDQEAAKHGLGSSIRNEIKALRERPYSEKFFCYLIVELDTETARQSNMTTPCAFLKLFDRRHSPTLRWGEGCRPWEEKLEQRCAKFLHSGKEGPFLTQFHTDWAKPANGCSDAEMELMLAQRLVKNFLSEAKTHELLELSRASVLSHFWQQCL